ncbi:hypothetical protein [Yersinia ruckeri]|uniref:hypothetical protein n=1 Tax=Yersinia ruckeri TaxID=29486 RepID=UPI00223757E5|nr:hypothetical protein [Yersinia ruckeri]MCW6598774.1 hypothetical protein [Yersinia ruckeri]
MNVLKRAYQRLTASQKANFVEAGVVLVDEYSNPREFKNKAEIWCQAILKKYGFLKYNWHWMDSMRTYDPVTDYGTSTNWIIQFEDSGLFSKGLLGPLVFFVENGVRGYIINAVSCGSILNSGRIRIAPNVRSSRDIFDLVLSQGIPQWINFALKRDISKRLGFTAFCEESSLSNKSVKVVLQFEDKAANVYSDDIENAIQFMSKYMSTEFRMNLVKTADTSYGKWVAYTLEFQPNYRIL